MLPSASIPNEKIKFLFKDLRTLVVLFSALGYFVDVFGVSILGVVRVQSLKDLGVLDSMAAGVLLINSQMFGMLVGSFFWGFLGDLRGRHWILLGAPLVYGVANLANGGVQDLQIYQVLRFVAGFGLAGELGASLSLIVETLPAKKRGYGTTLVATMGILGGLSATTVGENFTWQDTYKIGGYGALCLALLRFATFPALGQFYVKRNSLQKTSQSEFLKELSSLSVFKCALCVLGVGMPVWYVLGLIMPFAPELSQASGVAEGVSAGLAIFYCSVGVALGDFASGLISQWLYSRLKTIAIFLGLLGIGLGLLVFKWPGTHGEYYFLCTMMGFGAGYWAVFVTMTAEQFNRPIRTSATTIIPNFVRASVIPMSLLTAALVQFIGLSRAASGGLFLVVMIALICLFKLKETFALPLDISFGKDVQKTQ